MSRGIHADVRRRTSQYRNASFRTRYVSISVITVMTAIVVWLCFHQSVYKTAQHTATPDQNSENYGQIRRLFD